MQTSQSDKLLQGLAGQLTLNAPLPQISQTQTPNEPQSGPAVAAQMPGPGAEMGKVISKWTRYLVVQFFPPPAYRDSSTPAMLANLALSSGVCK